MRPALLIPIALCTVIMQPPALAQATDPDVKPGDKGVTISGKEKKKQSRFNVVDPPPISHPGKPSRPPRVGEEETQVAEEWVERGSCVDVGLSEEQLINRGCIDAPETPPVPGRPARPRIELITTDVVRAELKNVDFPALTVQVQPKDRTLVNLKTIVYAKPIPVDQIVAILTWPVGIRATASSYTWNFGDGTKTTTASEGSPYPAFDVFHQYKKRGRVAINVVVHYVARYQVPGQGWTTLPGTVDISGPATALTVAEARPVLVDPER